MDVTVTRISSTELKLLIGVDFIMLNIVIDDLVIFFTCMLRLRLCFNYWHISVWASIWLLTQSSDSPYCIITCRSIAFEIIIRCSLGIKHVPSSSGDAVLSEKTIKHREQLGNLRRFDTFSSMGRKYQRHCRVLKLT